ncbi:MAG: hypothetical protein SWH68_09025, partial [Thermodesulfobacteriota bacterium]|nr:hypothetical protein [Thermodesulfobacteriota bacterium]
FPCLSVYSVVNQTAVDYDHEKVEVAKQSFDPAIIRYFLQKRRDGVGSFLRSSLLRSNRISGIYYFSKADYFGRLFSKGRRINGSAGTVL